MIKLDLQQGSSEWFAHRAKHFNASDAPAMLGVSPYKTRSQLLHELATGLAPDIDDSTQQLFDEGHRSELLARTHTEKIIGNKLPPVVGTDGGKLSASFDGLTNDCLVCWEHKLLNDSLRGITKASDLPEHYRVQMEQQLLVSGALECLFSATKWEDKVLVDAVQLRYKPDPALREQIINGWAQFERDLETYTPPEVVEKPIPTAVMALPALHVQIKGEVTASNMPAFIDAADAFLGRIKTELVDDQDFADADANIKACDTAEKGIEQAKAAITAQAADIDTIMRTMDLYKTKLRDVRLKLKALVETEKDKRRYAIIAKAKAEYDAHVADLTKETGGPWIVLGSPDFAGAMKGLKKLSAMQEKVDNALRDAKMLADASAKKIRANLACIKNDGAGYEFLFNDSLALISKDIDDLRLLVKSRIENHKKAEAEKTERIRLEEEAKARAKVEAEQVAKKVPDPFHYDNRPQVTVHQIDEQKPNSFEIIEPEPSRAQLIAGVAEFWGVSEAIAEHWLIVRFVEEV